MIYIAVLWKRAQRHKWIPWRTWTHLCGKPLLTFDSHTRNKCQTEVNLRGEKRAGRGAETKREGTKRGWQSEHRELISHTQVQSQWSLRLLRWNEGKERGRGEKGDFDLIWQPETPSHCLYQKGREAWSVHCHKINTDTKRGETEIKRVIDVEREKVKAGRAKSEWRERSKEGKR